MDEQREGEEALPVAEPEKTEDPTQVGEGEDLKSHPRQSTNHSIPQIDACRLSYRATITDLACQAAFKRNLWVFVRPLARYERILQEVGKPEARQQQ